MRFIRDIISEKRGISVAATAVLPEGDTEARLGESLDTDTRMPLSDHPDKPLSLGAYQVEQTDSLEYADPQDAEESLFDLSDEESADPALDEIRDSEAPLREAMLDDVCAFEADDDGDGEDYFKDLEFFRKNEVKDVTDPFEKLRKERLQPSVASEPVEALRRSGLSDPDTGLTVYTQTPVAEPTPQPAAAEASTFEVPAPAAGRGSIRSGRVKTRLLGFTAGALDHPDMFDTTRSTSESPFPVGWLVVISELGRGASFALQDGVSKVGRGTDQTVSLNFGDNSISRDNHLSIAYDAEQNKFYIGHSGKSNLVRLNNKPLLSTEELRSRDQIRLGETTLRFIALCEDDFTWAIPDARAVKHA